MKTSAYNSLLIQFGVLEIQEDCKLGCVMLRPNLKRWNSAFKRFSPAIVWYFAIFQMR
jgi:hypothetical protein